MSNEFKQSYRMALDIMKNLKSGYVRIIGRQLHVVSAVHKIVVKFKKLLNVTTQKFYCSDAYASFLNFDIYGAWEKKTDEQLLGHANYVFSTGVSRGLLSHV